MDTMGKHIATGAVVLLLALFGAWLMIPDAVQGPAGRDGTSGKDGTFGALTGPNINSPFLKWGDVATFKTNVTLNTATNTPCSITSPAATSTLRYTALAFNTPTSTAITVWASVGTSAYATTSGTQLGKWPLASGKLGTFVFNATTTTTADDTGTIFPPSTNIVWTVAGTAIAGTANLNGTCQASWDVIP